MTNRPLLQSDSNENVCLKLLISYSSVFSWLEPLKTFTASNLTPLRKSCPCLHTHTHTTRVSTAFPICISASTEAERLLLAQMLLPVACSLKSLALSQGLVSARSSEVQNSYPHAKPNNFISKRPYLEQQQFFLFVFISLLFGCHWLLNSKPRIIQTSWNAEGASANTEVTKDLWITEISHSFFFGPHHIFLFIHVIFSIHDFLYV